jgi:hypothetical protein
MYFQTKNPNLGKIWRALEWKMLSYFITIWYKLWPFGVVCSHFVYFPVLVCLDQEKSGNTEKKLNRKVLLVLYLETDYYGQF